LDLKGKTKMISRAVEEAKELRTFLDQLRSEPGYWKHFTVLQFTTAMARLMSKPPRVSGKRLAGLLGVKPSGVSRALSGGENLTIETMTNMAGALGAAVHIHVAKKGVPVRWEEEAMEDSVPDAAQSAGLSRSPFHGSVLGFQMKPASFTTNDLTVPNHLLPLRIELSGADVCAAGS
jgi:transcriptional regulator with XRE-family HTH domain